MAIPNIRTQVFPDAASAVVFLTTDPDVVSIVAIIGDSSGFFHIFYLVA